VPLPLPPFTNGFVSAADLNAIIDAINGLPRGYINTVIDGTTVVTLNGGVLNAKAGGAHNTFTLTERRRITIWVVARFVPGTTTVGRYQIQAGVNPGSSVDLSSVQLAGARQPLQIQPTTGGDPDSVSGNAYGTIALDPGQYTAYGVVQRLVGGDNSDTASTFQTTLGDEGAG
jgi:hypothetical protein